MGSIVCRWLVTTTGDSPHRKASERFLVPLLLVGIILAAFPDGLRAEKTEGDAAVARRIEEQIRLRQADRRFACQGELICGIALIPDFYARRHFEPVWSTPRGPVPQALTLLAEISRVDEEGLDPGDYHFDRLRAMATLLGDGDAGDWARAPQLRSDFDLLMTDAAFLLGSHRLGGRVNPEAIHASWSAFDHEVDLIRLLDDRLRRQSPAPLLQDLQPSYAGYAGLRQALAEYRRLA
ncbi:MAG TPA: hypothetical protein VLT88_13295, partial [Desulfosarcina sp.]|nr:hypothetical protein [Desulfosarcina sp.]